MYREVDLKAIGDASVGLLERGDIVVNRRVESVAFPITASTTVRRRLSIDFNIPEGVQPLRRAAKESGSEEHTYYLPLSVLLKWPPVDNLDLRDAQDRPLPLLTRHQNAIADAALLTSFAQKVVREPLDPFLERQLRRIPRSGTAIAEGVWKQLFRHEAPADSTSAYDRQRTELRGHAYFADIAGGLVDSTILWLRTVGEPGSRHVVKFAYDARVDLRGVSGLTPVALAWQPLNVELDVPHIGNSGSYHLIFETPPPLRVTDARIELLHRRPDASEPATPRWGDFLLRLSKLDGAWQARQQRRAAAASSVDASTTAFEGDGPSRQPLATGEVTMQATPRGNAAHFYVSGERPHTDARADLTLMVTKRGSIRSSSVAAALIFGLLLTYALRLPDAVALGGGALTMLLLVPGLLAYVVARPGEHAMASAFFRWLRLLLLLTGLLPVIGAGALLANGRLAASAQMLRVPASPASRTSPSPTVKPASSASPGATIKQAPKRSTSTTTPASKKSPTGRRAPASKTAQSRATPASATTPSPGSAVGRTTRAVAPTPSLRPRNVAADLDTPTWLQLTFDVLAVLAGTFALVFGLSCVLPPRRLRRPFTGTTTRPDDPLQSRTADKFRRLSVGMTQAEMLGDEAAIRALITEVEEAELSDDEREQILDRAAQYLSGPANDPPRESG